MRFLFFDRVLELEPGKRILARKNVGMDGEYFTGHYRGRPVMPGTLIIESFAQAAGWLNFITNDRSIRMVVALVEDVSFHRGVLPGDSMEIEARMLFMHPGGVTMGGEVRVEGELAARVERMVFANQIFDRSQLNPGELEHYRYVESGSRLREAIRP